jgi:hypothetical protein
MSHWVIKSLLLSLLLCAPGTSSTVIAQDHESVKEQGECKEPNPDWFTKINADLTSTNNSYAQILGKVPHWREKLKDQLKVAKDNYENKDKSGEAVGDSARKVMNILEEGAQRGYYSQESKERLKSLFLDNFPNGIKEPLIAQVVWDGKIGAGFGIIVLLAFFVALTLSAQVHPLDLIITSEDNRVSLSRLQFWLWFVVVMISWGAVSWTTRRLQPVPENLYILMGVNVGATVAATAITVVKGIPPRADKPRFFTDVFLDSRRTLDLPRVQMFVWTIVILVGYLIVLVENYHQGLPSLPVIPEGLIVLMGISQGAYLGSKATGTTVDTATPKPPGTSINTIAALRRKATAAQQQEIDGLISSMGYAKWDDFVDRKPVAPTQDQIDRLSSQLKAKGIQ